MRIESVTAHAFGPLVDQTLELGSGLTVIAGANESAKSSWHAALYSAVCGRRRGRGAPTKDEARYIRLHRPWEGAQWRVSAIIVLDDGTRIEMKQDLDGKVDCRATDMSLGRDVSANIMVEGSPDASRYLGLDRRSFAATASVNQAELLSVLAAADGLQEHLQRAAATAGTAATAAAALQCLDQFARERVGLDRSNSSKPLRAAKNRLEEAGRRLQFAVAAHAEYLRLAEDADSTRVAATEAAVETTHAEAAVSALAELLAAARDLASVQEQFAHAEEMVAERSAELQAEERRLDRVTQLHSRFGDSAPAGLTEQDDAAAAVASAIASWTAAPIPRQATGQTSADIERALAALPERPTGDTRVDESIRGRATDYERAVAVLATHAERVPATDGTTIDPELAAAVTAGAAVLRELATELSAVTVDDDGAPVAVVSSAEAALEKARHEQAAASEAATLAQRAADAARDHARAATAPAPAVVVLAPPTRSKRTALLASGALIALLGVVAVIVGLVVPGAAAGVVGAVVLALSLRTRVDSSAPIGGPSPRSMAESDRLEAALRAAEDEFAAARTAVLTADRLVAECEGRFNAASMTAKRSEGARASVAAQCETRGLPADAAQLRRLAAQAEQLSEQRTTMSRWRADQDLYAADVARAEAQLRDGLSSRGGDSTAGTPVLELFARYEAACTARAEQAVAADRRESLEQSLVERRASETAAAELAAARERAFQALLEAATVAAVPVPVDASAELAIEQLTAWQRERSAQVQELEQDRSQWSEYQTLLDGLSVEELGDQVAKLRDDCARLSRTAADRRAEVQSAVEIRDARAQQAQLAIPVAANVPAVEQGLAEAKLRLQNARTISQSRGAAAEHTEGSLRERARTLPSVSEAEESQAAARVELDRVTELAQTLMLTQQFLSAAQDRVHRDVAPVLAATLQEWLPSVTGGRYVEALVDPATLGVQVRGAVSRSWRSADQLSIGTAEQIFLLLRVALAQHLATTGESCPLFLDDVTVQADPGRTQAILDLLLDLSGDRQIVLFAQDPVVAEWARQRSHLLTLRELAPVATD